MKFDFSLNTALNPIRTILSDIKVDIKPELIIGMDVELI